MDIRLLKITIATNIPGNKMVEFTSSMLYHPEYTDLKVNSKYPYVTSYVDYSDAELEHLSYPEIVQFFYDKPTFINTISKIPSDVKPSDTTNVLNRNIMTMLRLLFPTKYYTVNNLKQSISLLEPSVAVNTNSIFYNLFNTHSSYLKIQNKKYTVSEVIWLNDIVNHPEYRTLLEEIYNVKLALKNYANERSELIGISMQKTINTLTELVKQLSDIIKSERKEGNAVKSSGYASKKQYITLITLLFFRQFLENINQTYEELVKSVDTNIDKMVKETTSSADDDKTNLYTILKQMVDNSNADLDANPKISRFQYYNKLVSDIIKKDADTRLINENFATALSTDNWTRRVNELLNKDLNEQNIKTVKEYLDTNTIKFTLETKTKGSSSNTIPIVYQFINNVQYKYVRPERTSSNVTLQKYIDGKTPEDTAELFKVAEQLYNKYILHNKDAANSIDNSILNVGVNNINIDRTGNLPTKEIFVELILIDGEVNETNKSEIYCPITNEKLGNELMDLLSKDEDNSNLLNKLNTIYSVDAQRFNANKANVQTKLNKSEKPVNNNEVVVGNKQKDILSDYVYSKFFPKIIGRRDTALTDIIDEIRKVVPEYNKLEQDKLLEFINNTYVERANSSPPFTLPDLPKQILQWSKKDTYNNELVNNLTRIKNSLDTDIAIIKKDTNEREFTPEQKSKLLSHLAIIKLYVYVVTKLMEDENKKQGSSLTGGKVHKKSKQKTTKNKKNTHYKTYKRHHR